MIHKRFPVLIWKEGDQYVVRCIEPELASCGDTIPEALANIQEALELYFENRPEMENIAVVNPQLTEVEIAI